MAILCLVLAYVGTVLLIGGVLHELEASYRPFRRTPRRAWRGGSRWEDQ